MTRGSSVSLVDEASLRPCCRIRRCRAAVASCFAKAECVHVCVPAVPWVRRQFALIHRWCPCLSNSAEPQRERVQSSKTPAREAADSGDCAGSALEGMCLLSARLVPAALSARRIHHPAVGTCGQLAPQPSSLRKFVQASQGLSRTVNVFPVLSKNVHGGIQIMLELPGSG